MAESLLCILLITSSVRESTVVYRWPDNPKPSPRLTRPHPNPSLSISLLDNPWRASNDDDDDPIHPPVDDAHYAWSKPRLLKLKSHNSHNPWHEDDSPVPDNEYESILGFDSEFLARILCPHKSMCHQKFELVVDDLAFIGHPVSVDSLGNWAFKSENTISRPGTPPLMDRDRSRSHSSSASNCDSLQTFHVVLVLDVPDPSSSASGNVLKYFNVLYEQIAFILTAVLYGEQVAFNFVQQQCDTLTSLRDSCVSKGEPYSLFSSKALETTSLAPAFKTLFEAIKSSSVAYLTINHLVIELQLPPYLDTFLLHNQNQEEQEDFDTTTPSVDFGHTAEDGTYPVEDAEIINWGQDMSAGWKLPMVAPWKTLLLLDVDKNADVPDPRQPQLNKQENQILEGLIRFLETVSVTASLRETARQLEFDLESQVYPIVKWLLLHRRAKIVDVVHPGLRTVFALPAKFNAPLSELTQSFEAEFSHPSIPPLPLLLSQISLSLSRPSSSDPQPQQDNHAHFFASVVKSKELIPMYYDVVLWMMKRDLLVALHLRVRIVATTEVKAKVREMRESWIARKRYERIAEKERAEAHGEVENREDGILFRSVYYDLSSGRRRRSYRRKPRRVHEDFVKKESSDDDGESVGEGEEWDDEQGHSEDDGNEEDEGWDSSLEEGGDAAIQDPSPSIISDPGRATPLESRWLAAMSIGKDPEVVRRFELINQFFDGKRSDDEILYRAEITRKQLREVLHHYEQFLQTFLHPS